MTSGEAVGGIVEDSICVGVVTATLGDGIPIVVIADCGAGELTTADCNEKVVGVIAMCSVTWEVDDLQPKAVRIIKRMG
jgi:hypothetical protein